MTIEFITTALFGISLITGLTVEALKKILDNTKIKYSSNILAAIVSIIISLGSSIIYIAVMKVSFSFLVAAEIFGIMFLSFLVSTIGYDKVIQTVKQIITSKNENDKTDDGNK